jgi:Arc/MetJ-type ribon-helix-helix transcriptional regulator
VRKIRQRTDTASGGVGHLEHRPMSRNRRVTVDVPETLWADVEARVAKGDFPSTSDAVTWLLLDDSMAREEETFEQEVERRLRALPEGATDEDPVRIKQEINDRRHAELQALLHEGLDDIEQGDVTEFDLDQFLAEAKQRLAAEAPKRETA